MKIINLQASNIKKLVAVDITPMGNVVQITGGNYSGKTCVLDSIWWALAGAGAHQKEPIRTGKDSAQIRLDLGEYIVTRDFVRRKNDRVTTMIKVENADDARFGSPQALLDSLLDSISFDPLMFARMTPIEQAQTLAELVGIDVVSVNAKIKEEYDKRRNYNSKCKDKVTEAARIKAAGAPDELIDSSVVAKELADAGEHNNRVSEQIQRSNDLAHMIDATQQVIAKEKETIASLENDLLENIKTVDEWQREIESLKIEDPIDISKFSGRFNQIEADNQLFRQAKLKKSLLDEAEKYGKKSKALTRSMDNRRKKMAKAVADADLGIDGLELGDGYILLKGFPFDQASAAEKLDVSCSIVMQGDHKLKVIRIQDGSLLDDTNLAIVVAKAKKYDYQVWIEQVDTSGSVGIVIEDGKVVADNQEK